MCSHDGKITPFPVVEDELNQSNHRTIPNKRGALDNQQQKTNTNLLKNYFEYQMQKTDLKKRLSKRDKYKIQLEK